VDQGNHRVGTRANPRRGAKVNNRGSVRLLKAFAHPLRVAILARLDEDVLSPKELAGELRASLPVVSYHVRELERLKMIQLVRTAQRRGAVQHWYRAKSGAVLAQREWAAASARTRREAVGVALARLEAVAVSASEEGGFNRADVQLSRETLALDERGFDELVQLIRDVRGRVAEVSEAAQSRLVTSGLKPLHATLSLMLFEGPYGKPRTATRRRRAETAPVSTP
jgi:DNA-binding transcriptional ArsR family regulator